LETDLTLRGRTGSVSKDPDVSTMSMLDGQWF